MSSPSVAGLPREAPCFATPPRDGCAFVGSRATRVPEFIGSSLIGSQNPIAQVVPRNWTHVQPVNYLLELAAIVLHGGLHDRVSRLRRAVLAQQSELQLALTAVGATVDQLVEREHLHLPFGMAYDRGNHLGQMLG